MSLEIGIGRISITPEFPVMLAGYSTERWSDNVRDELWAKVIALRLAGREVLVVALDLIWVSRSFRDEIVDTFTAEFGLESESVLISCTHTHSGPEVRENTFYPPRPSGEYKAFLRTRVLDAGRSARQNLESGTISQASMDVTFAVNRRKRTIDLTALRKGKISVRMSNRPNTVASLDPALNTLWLYQRGKLAAVIVNYACHPTFLRGRDISGDYPGAIERHLQADHNINADVIFLQGFAANLSPRRIRMLPFVIWPPGRLLDWLFDREQFDRSTPLQAVEQMAADLADQCMAMRPLPVEVSMLRCKMTEILLPINAEFGLPDTKSGYEIATSFKSEYESFISKAHDNGQHIPFRIQTIEIGESQILVALEGEIFSEFAVWLRNTFAERFQGMMTISCANGMVGYIPTDEALSEGGYETARSIFMFGLPGQFAFGVEKILKESLRKLLLSS